jgi:hypothetical protein
MSFGFIAAGKREDVITALKNTDTHGNQIGAALRDAIITGLEEDAVKAGNGYQYIYVVEAGGHSGGAGTSPLSLTATVKSYYQVVPAAAEAAEDATSEALDAGNAVPAHDQPGGVQL